MSYVIFGVVLWTVIAFSWFVNHLGETKVRVPWYRDTVDAVIMFPIIVMVGLLLLYRKVLDFTKRK